MEKAYDLKDLVAKIKASGLPIAEEAGEQIIKAVFVWLKESAVASASPYDDMASFIYPKVEELILAQIEKIAP